MTLPTLRNLGPKSATWLREIGIHSKEDLEKIGVVQAYRMLKSHDKKVSLNMLWAMEGALTNKDWRSISAKRKEELKKLI